MDSTKAKFRGQKEFRVSHDVVVKKKTKKNKDKTTHETWKLAYRVANTRRIVLTVLQVEVGMPFFATGYEGNGSNAELSGPAITLGAGWLRGRLLCKRFGPGSFQFFVLSLPGSLRTWLCICRTTGVKGRLRSAFFLAWDRIKLRDAPRGRARPFSATKFSVYGEIC